MQDEQRRPSSRVSRRARLPCRGHRSAAARDGERRRRRRSLVVWTLRGAGRDPVVARSALSLHTTHRVRRTSHLAPRARTLRTTNDDASDHPHDARHRFSTHEGRAKGPESGFGASTCLYCIGLGPPSAAARRRCLGADSRTPASASCPTAEGAWRPFLPAKDNCPGPVLPGREVSHPRLYIMSSALASDPPPEMCFVAPIPAGLVNRNCILHGGLTRT
jgi:hypothetical protein